jgi:hypothetical protein
MKKGSINTELAVANYPLLTRDTRLSDALVKRIMVANLDYMRNYYILITDSDTSK